MKCFVPIEDFDQWPEGVMLRPYRIGLPLLNAATSEQSPTDSRPVSTPHDIGKPGLVADARNEPISAWKPAA